FPQRVAASASGTEAIALVSVPRLENRFDHEPNRLLDDAVRDRWNAQRPRLAIALRDFDPFDGLRTVRTLPQQRRQHAFRPDRGFGPRKVPCGLSALRSLIGTPGGPLLRFVQRRISLPAPLPSGGFMLSRPLAAHPFGWGHSGTVRALTPARLAHAEQASPLTCV